MQVDGRPVMRSIAHVKQDMLAQLRQVTPPGQSPMLSPEHNDIVELLSLLFENISREFSPTSPAAQLLSKLQVPMLRVALSDKGFFTRRQHPARLMLNAVAETGATWLRDGEDIDQGLLDKLNVVVDKVTHEFNDDPAIFEGTVGDLEQQMQTQARKAEVAERRHVEAARGKEKLALARQGAEAAVAAQLKGQNVPKFVSALLNQAWTDVLALSLLRGGEESPVYQRQIEIVDQLIRVSTGQIKLAGAELAGLRDDVEHALVKVGYHENDASALVARLLAGPDDVATDDASTRTELALKLKSRTRLGTSGLAWAPVASRTTSSRNPYSAPMSRRSTTAFVICPLGRGSSSMKTTACPYVAACPGSVRSPTTPCSSITVVNAPVSTTWRIWRGCCSLAKQAS